MGIVRDVRQNTYSQDLKIRESRNGLSTFPFGGESDIAQYDQTAATVAANSLLSSTESFIVPAGRMIELHELSISADRDCMVVVRIASVANVMVNANAGISGTVNDIGAYSTPEWIFFSGKDTKKIKFPDGFILQEYTQITISYWRTGSGTVTKPYIKAFLRGIDMTADRNYEANSVITLLSDSYGHTNSGNIFGDQYFPFVGRDKLIDIDNKSVRLVVKSHGGAVSATSAQLVRSGWLDFPTDVLAVSLGFNDINVANATWTSTRRQVYKDSINQIITIARRTAKRYKKNTSIIIFKPYPPISTDTQRNSNFADACLALQEVKDASSDSLLFIGDFSTVYANNSANYYTDNIHANASGHALIGNKFYQDLKTTDWFINRS